MHMRFTQAPDLPREPRRSAWQGAAVLTVLAALMVTAGCSTRRVAGPAPVEDRGMTRPAATVVLPGAENAGKPGYYTVKPGDTLFRIALDNGQNWRDVQAWNNLTNPDVIEVGQVLRVAPPGGAVETAGVVVRPIAPAANSSAAMRSLAFIARHSVMLTTASTSW